MGPGSHSIRRQGRQAATTDHRGVIVAIRADDVARTAGSVRSASSSPAAGRRFVAAACLIFATSGGVNAVLVCVLLVAGGVAHALGEVRQAAGSWGVAFELAPDHAMGQYQGTHAMGQDIGQMIAPAIFTSLTLVLGVPEWIVLAAAFAVLGALMPPVVSIATRKRARTAAAVAALRPGLSQRAHDLQPLVPVPLPDTPA